LTAADERILFTKHFSGTALTYCAEPQNVLSVAQALLRWKMCICIIFGAAGNRNATNQSLDASVQRA
jgi:hypothetical protein